MERLGIGRAPWEREEEEAYYTPATKPENQLGTGIPVRTPVSQTIRTPQPVEASWDDDWQQPPAPEPKRRRAAEPVYYEEEDRNWGDDQWVDAPSRPVQYDKPVYSSSDPYKKDYADEYTDYEVEGDAWDDDVESESYRAPKVNIPEKTKTPEYEEEAGY